MAATAATALHFSYLQSRATPEAASSLRPTSLRTFRFPSSRGWRLPRMLAAVAHEEASAWTTAAAGDASVEATAEEVEGEAAAPAAEEVVEEAEETGGEAPQGSPSSATKLYFGNLPYNCDSAHLAGIVQQYATPEMVEVLYDKQSGKSRGFAFVTMSSVADCQTVIENLDGTEYSGRMIRVNFADRPRSREPLYPETEFKLFVGNLPWTATSENLCEVFKECGNVVGARVVYDGETGRSRGYGFVCYATKEEMDAAMESLDGEEIEGRPVRISIAQGRRSQVQF